MNQIQEIFSLRIKEMQELVNQTNKSSVLIIQQFPTDDDTTTKYPKVRESISNILAFIELGTLDILKEVIKISDGVFDYIVFDSDVKIKSSVDLIQEATIEVKKSIFFCYSDINSWTDSAVQFILQKEKGLINKKVFISGQGILKDAVQSRIKLFNPIFVTKNVKADLIIGCEIKKKSVDVENLFPLKNGGNAYDIGIGNFSIEFIEASKVRDCEVFRIDIRAGISSVILNILETDFLIHKIMGKTVLNNIEIVAGGIMGNNRAVIVDDINSPTNIIGIADGIGNIKDTHDKHDINSMKFVELLISKK